ncbi:MAG: hypothetical protein ACK4V4_05575 [Sphingobacteriales bacterium]
MVKLLLILSLLFTINKCFSQIDTFYLDLNKDNTNRIYNLCPDVSLNILIYPEITRNGVYELVNKKRAVVYSEKYMNVDYILINFSQKDKSIPNGKYKLKFISDEGEVDYLNLHLFKRKNHIHSSVTIPALKSY